MAITLHYGSGSPFAWKVWLALEHKQLPYELKVLSFDRGDTRSPEFLALNPRGKVPTLVDGDLVLWESAVILEYLEDRYPERPLLPKDPAGRALARRIAAEADSYLYAVQSRLGRAVFRPADERDATEIAAAVEGLVPELDRFAGYLNGDWFAGPLSFADFTVYPYIRAMQRAEERAPGLKITALIPPALAAWARRVAELPYHDKTLPPHWKG